MVAAPSGNLTGTAGGSIALNASSGAATIVWHVDNPVSPKVTVGTATFATTATGNLPDTLGHGTSTITLSDGATTLATLTVSMDCVTGTSWDGAACTAPVLHYAATDIAVRFGRPGIMTLAAPWTEATNQTSYQTGAIPIFNAMVSEAPLDNGYFLEVVWAASDSSPHVVQHNPVTNVVTDYAGTVPPGYEVTRTGSTWTFDPKWHATSWGTAPYSYMLRWAVDASGGYFYTDVADDRIERYQSATGVQSVLYTSPDGGAFTVMISISH